MSLPHYNVQYLILRCQHAGWRLHKDISVFSLWARASCNQCLFVCLFAMCREAIGRLLERTSAKTSVKTIKVRPAHTRQCSQRWYDSVNCGFLFDSRYARDRRPFWVKSTCSFLGGESSSLSPQTAWVWSPPPPYRLQPLHVNPNNKRGTLQLTEPFTETHCLSVSLLSLLSPEDRPSPDPGHFVRLGWRPSTFPFLNAPRAQDIHGMTN